MTDVAYISRKLNYYIYIRGERRPFSSIFTGKHSHEFIYFLVFICYNLNIVNYLNHCPKTGRVQATKGKTF